MNALEQIQQASLVIDTNVSALKDNYGLMSQNILAQLRNLVEVVAFALDNIGKPYYDYSDIGVSLKNIDRIKEYKYIYKFYKHLEIVSSHYTLDAVNSEHLVYYYIPYLIKLKQTVGDKLGIVILRELSDMVRASATQECAHYAEISKLLKNGGNDIDVEEKRRLYVVKQKPIVVNEEVIFESVLSNSKTRTNKSDGILVYSNFALPDHYAIKIKYRRCDVIANKISVPVTVVSSCSHAIYPREFNLLAKIVGEYVRVNHNSNSYKQLMSILDESYSSLLDIIDNIENYSVDKTEPIWRLLYKCKSYLSSNKSGSTVLRYLIYTLNYDILSKQYCNKPCEHLLNLYLLYGCIPFDKMPYCTSLVSHNPSVSTLLECIEYKDREHEFLSRFLQNKAAKDNQLYVSLEELHNFQDIQVLVTRHNENLYRDHKHREICSTKNNYLYIKGNEDSLKNIIKKLSAKCSFCVKNHEAYTNNWILNRKDPIDSEEKKIILKKLFSDTMLSLIVGPAGTGKTTLINYISELYSFAKIHYLANTNAAVENIKRKVLKSDGCCQTVTSFLYENRNSVFKCNILIIDECSTISNLLMEKLLNVVEPNCIILVGDDFQLGSIEYGNWFAFAQRLLPARVTHELKTIHRSANNDLCLLWDSVRRLDPHVHSFIGKVNCSANLDDSVYETFSEDQIILNLNYDGMYGINNINAIMQSSNPNFAVRWGVYVYKIGDPIIFRETTRFENIFFNNLKGKITNIQIKSSPRRITFEVEIDRVLNSMSIRDNNCEAVNFKDNSTVVSFDVFEPRDIEEEDNENCIVPFVVSYATSIHKSQGLEYDSVKIIITEDNVQNITHDIFYTAVTRAKNKLTIYWSKETEKTVVDNLKTKNINKDLNIFRINTNFNGSQS